MSNSKTDAAAGSPVKIVIVGGVAGGASAATRARRMNEQAEIILFEKDDYVSFANCGMPYHIGGEIPERDDLLVAPRELLENRFRLDVRTRQEVLKIDRAEKQLTILNHDTGAEYQETYDKLILSPGASPLMPPLPGIDAEGVFSLRNLADMDRISAAVAGGTTKRAVVVGAGFIGLEMIEQFENRGLKVALAELQPQVLPLLDHEMAQPLEAELNRRGVELYLGDGIESIEVDDAGHAAGVQLKSGTFVSGELVVLGLGVRPNIQLAKEAGLEIAESGAIRVNEHLQTNDPDIYAVGDAIEYPAGPTGSPMRIALAGPANRAGRLAGEHAATGSSEPLAQVFGTSIVRLFDQAAAVTGLTAKLAERLGIEARSVTIVGKHHAGYYPGASPLALKLLYAPADGRILGAQAVGRHGIDKRIDVLATAMAMKATVRDLAGLDLAYAPPYGAAKDPIHMAAFAACNDLDGVDKFLPSDSDLSEYQVVDVRSASESAAQPLAGAENAKSIPVDELRERLGELDSSLPTVVSCGVGVRAHVAARILRQNGFEQVYNLAGGATIRARSV